MERLRRSKRKEPTIAEQFVQLPEEEQEKYRKKASELGWPPPVKSWSRWTPENLWKTDETLAKIETSFTTLIDELQKENREFQPKLNPAKEELGFVLQWSLDGVNKQMLAQIVYGRRLNLENLQLSIAAGRFDTDDQGNKVYLNKIGEPIGFSLAIDQSRLTLEVNKAYKQLASWKKDDLIDVSSLGSSGMDSLQ